MGVPSAVGVYGSAGTLCVSLGSRDRLDVAERAADTAILVAIDAMVSTSVTPTSEGGVTTEATSAVGATAAIAAGEITAAAALVRASLAVPMMW